LASTRDDEKVSWRAVRYKYVGCSHTPFVATTPTGAWPTSMKLSVSLRFTRSYIFGRTPWAGDLLVARPLPVHKHRKTHTPTQTLNIHALSGVRIHIPASERGKTVHALDRSATVTGITRVYSV
jgi:hypothetical protein